MYMYWELSFKIINTNIIILFFLLNSTLECVVTNEMREVVGRNNQEHYVGSCNVIIGQP